MNDEDLGDDLLKKLYGIRRSSTDEGNVDDDKISPPPNVDDFFRYVSIFDKKVSKEIYEMSKENREAFQNELHGVQSQAVPETRATIQSGLEKMDLEISKMVSQQSSSDSSNATTILVKSHLMAVGKLKSTYVVAPEFRIRFLRAELYDAKNAAVRYFKHLKVLYENFGEFSLRRPLQLSDLSPIAKAILKSGQLQVLRSRDRMGRRIRVTHAGLLAEYPKLERWKAVLYLVTVLGEDEETQIHGIIKIFTVNFRVKSMENINDVPVSTWNDSEKMIFHKMVEKSSRGIRPKEVLKFVEGSPIRVSSIHICIPNKKLFRIYKSYLLWLLPRYIRQRTRIHMGSHLECCYELSQFGIPTADIENYLTNGLMNQKSYVAKFLRAREFVESFRKKYSERHGFDYYQQFPREIRVRDDKNGKESSDEGTTAYKIPQPSTVISADVCPGTECPESNTVIFGDRIAYKYPANVEFREYCRMKDFFSRDSDAGITTAAASIAAAAMDNSSGTKNSSKSLVRLKVEVLDNIINEVYMTRTGNADNDDFSFGNYSTCTFARRKGFKFAVYEKHQGWYRYMNPINSESDRIELRKRISQTIRDERKRTMTGGNFNQQKRLCLKRYQQRAPSEAWTRSNPLPFIVEQQNSVQQSLILPTNNIGFNPHNIADTCRSFKCPSTVMINEIHGKRTKMHHCNFCEQCGIFHRCLCGRWT